jgi:hypothetical protein
MNKFVQILLKLVIATFDLMKNEKNHQTPDQKKLLISCYDLMKVDLMINPLNEG